jgi:hypothetical protein
MATGNTSRRLKNVDLHVDPTVRPGWETGDGRIPQPGETVYCTEGEAEVAKVRGKTGDGSRLLELRLLDKAAPPFYAAASNVLLRRVAEAKTKKK